MASKTSSRSRGTPPAKSSSKKPLHPNHHHQPPLPHRTHHHRCTQITTITQTTTATDPNFSFTPDLLSLAPTINTHSTGEEVQEGKLGVMLKKKQWPGLMETETQMLRRLRQGRLRCSIGNSRRCSVNGPPVKKFMKISDDGGANYHLQETKNDDFALFILVYFTFL
ncbi:hypothetical protein Hdeb2414_s0007g00249041 [Helianthus debilis subsp. tardiflorus]